MSLLDDFRVDIGDDDGAIPSGIVPVPGSGLPIGVTATLLNDFRLDVGDDDGAIATGVIINGVPIHNLLSPEHGDTISAAPSNAALIVGVGSNWVLLPSGNEGETLSIQGNAVTWTPDANVSGALAAHIADPSAHHARYTDAEASGVAVQVVVTGIAQHANIPDAHHARYTDAEASGVAVQVVVTGIAQHAAISGAHHPRYTDAEAAAVAAAVLATGVVSADNLAILQESGVELTADATTTAVTPVFSTLLSSSINLINSSGNLRISATAAINANGAVPVLFHIYIDGVFYRATTINVTGAIDNASIVIPRVAITGVNPHTVELRWAKFFMPAVTVFCLPAALPAFYHASLSVQEIQ